MDLTFECGLFLLGLVLGSFLNVCISRLPRDQSIISPGSHCPACGAAIRWYDNIPVLSWLFLRGRCRACGAGISLRYPAVEVLVAVLFTASYLWFGPTLLTVKFCLFCFLSVGLLFMDAETGLLPREFTYIGILLGLALSRFAPTDASAAQMLFHAYSVPMSAAWVSFLDSLLAATLGAGFFFVAAGLYWLIRHRQGMGIGDFALMAMSGAFLGLKLTLLVMCVAPLLASFYAIVRIARHGSAGGSISVGQMLQSGEIPFGVFISAASLGTVFFGENFWQWYLRFF